MQIGDAIESATVYGIQSEPSMSEPKTYLLALTKSPAVFFPDITPDIAIAVIAATWNGVRMDIVSGEPLMDMMQNPK